MAERAQLVFDTVFDLLTLTMARTIAPVAGAGHASGYTSNSNKDKLLREMYKVLIALEWTPVAAKAAIENGGLTDIDCFINLKEKDISEFVITIRKVPVPVGAMQKLYFSWMCWVARHHAHIGREISWGDVSIA